MTVTNSESIDEYRVITERAFVVCNTANSRTERLKFITLTTVPYMLPILPTKLPDMRDKFFYKLNNILSVTFQCNEIHTQTYIRCTALCTLSGITRVSRCQNQSVILLKQETVSGSGFSWAACNSAPRPRQITMPASMLFMWLCPSVVHSFLECPLYTTVRGKYFSVLSMEELFHTIRACNMHAFICEIGFYHHM